MDHEVQSLVAAHAPHLQIAGDGRVKCTLNGHVMPATLVAVKAFTGYLPLQQRSLHLALHRQLDASGVGADSEP